MMNKVAVPKTIREMVKEIAMDIGKQTAHHIEIMYPEAVKHASGTFLLSVRNTVYNEIMDALKVENESIIIRRLEIRKKLRRKIKRAYSLIRREVH